MSHGTHGFDVIAPRSPFYRGPFGRICSDLPPWAPSLEGHPDLESLLMTIAQGEMIERPTVKPTDIAQDAALRADLDAQFNSAIPAGYTYFGQFVDHDITFDPASSLMRRNDPSGLLNHRTPRLDLDNVYGAGPDDAPYLYDQDKGRKGRLLIGNIPGTNLPDLPRNQQGRALIGDMRNDENAIVSQLQLAFLLAHNALVEEAEKQGADNPFEAARRTLRWLYQWIVWHDFLKRVTRPDVWACALQLQPDCLNMPDGPKRWRLGLKDIYSWRNQPYMPVEFSAAAYRFGHSMVRNHYQTNSEFRGLDEFVPIFDSSSAGAGDLRGFGPMVPENVVQWDWFLEMGNPLAAFPQRARKIDTRLANSLAFLAEEEDGSPMNILARRNLLRGIQMDLPAGTAVARKFCVEPIATLPENRDFLWYYILK
ncbi:MAG: hypothetical protein KDE04_13285, partial [Anaerolineales bacterium]|nr:hypothetical protein [Anaerolineales bacterium]